ncbi:MAG: hypothetical protein FWG71_01960, partial [Synergistaceae bacterium]|nr:hypothetical protein [Synergistaceae bacterium]
TVESGTLTLNSASRPAISASDGIVLGAGAKNVLGTAHAALASGGVGKINAATSDITAPAITSVNGSVSILGGVDVSAKANGGSAIKAATEIIISTKGNVSAETVGDGNALEAEAINIISGTVNLKSENDAFRGELMYGPAAEIVVNGKPLYKGDTTDDDGGAGAKGGGCSVNVLWWVCLPLLLLITRKKGGKKRGTRCV